MTSVDTTHTAHADTAASGGGENIGHWIEHHLRNSNEWHIPGLHLHLPHFEPVNLFGIPVDLSISNHVVMLWIAGLILVLMFRLSYNPKKKHPTGFGALIEMLVIFIRDEIAIANMGVTKTIPRTGVFGCVYLNLAVVVKLIGNYIYSGNVIIYKV